VTIVTVSKTNRDNCTAEKLLDGSYGYLAAIIIGLSRSNRWWRINTSCTILVYLFKINRNKRPVTPFIVGFTAMIGSFSHHKGNLKIKSALVLLFPLFLSLATSQENYATATS
jgi:hypothetical protein